MLALIFQHVTYTRIKQAIFSLWIVVLLLVCLPFLGFGVYYDSDASDKRFMCIRYRFATKSKDKVYAYLMFVFGLLLCLVIVYCNLAVVRVLCRMGKKCMARMGRTTIRKDSRELSYNHTTPEEISFAKFMVVLCVFFVVCWVPQLITIPLAQINPIIQDRKFFRLADIGIALNFTLDPIVYVLSRKPHRKGLRTLLKPLCKFCWPQSDRSSSEVSAAPYKPIFESCTPGPQQDLPGTESEQQIGQGLNSHDVLPQNSQSSSIQHFHCQCSASSDEGMDVNVTRCRSGLQDHIILEIRIRATSWGSATPSVYFHKNKCPIHSWETDTEKGVHTKEGATPISSSFPRAFDFCHAENEKVSDGPGEILVPYISIENSPLHRCGTHGKASLGIAEKILVPDICTENNSTHKCSPHGNVSLGGDHLSACSPQGIFSDVRLKVVENTWPSHENQNERTTADRCSHPHEGGLPVPSLPLPPPPRGRSYSTGMRPYRRNLELYTLSRPAEV
ncbi:uncharacterized protein LOC106468643 [Limulus polyphemus]|uniref:Uncharacterized protein LOC106468643 n=1 Tax=Limulus polyphemus TaxID=6850 RepID=A0ABM1BLP7_LIMPO|nr:uncharacterized protein LOC106468643 [Limulus polyphemus]